MPEKHRVAVIGHTGHGDYGHGLDRVWLMMPQCQIVGLADPDEGGRAKAAARLNVKKSFADWRQMLDETRPAFVSICPRWLDQHRDMAVGAAERGIHIYMEKPFCRSLAEADEIVDACQRNSVKLAIAFQTRYSPIVAMVRQMIEDGDIGDLLELRGRGKEDRRGGGEDLWVLGSHIMNLMHYFGGDPSWCFARVRSDQQETDATAVHDGAEGIGPLAGDHLNAMYGMEDGVIGYFGSRREARGPEGNRFGLQIFGSRGIIELTTGYLPQAHVLADSTWSPGRSGKEWVPISSAGPGKPEPIRFREGHAAVDAGNMAACNDLIAAVEEDRQPEANMLEARMTVEMISGVFASHRAGGPVTIPNKNRSNPLSDWNSK